MARYFTLVITKTQIIRVTVTLIALIVIGTSPVWWSKSVRLLTGVEPNVTVAGVPVGGKLESEVREIVTELAKAAAFLPQDAYWDSQANTVVPASSGRYVDIEQTVRRVMVAPAGTEVPLVVVNVSPAVPTQSVQPIYQGPNNEPKMALTINVDWGQEVLPDMLKVLAEKNVKVTFFLTGRWAQKFPEDARRLAEAGHEIGNHGLRHDHPKQLSDWELTRLICDNDELLRQITGKAAPLFAPPYGEVDSRIASIAARHGFRTIMWTIDTVDWKDPSPSTIISRVVDKATNGAIVLMHPKPNTLRALPEIIDRLRDKGFELVTVSELLDGTS